MHDFLMIIVKSFAFGAGLGFALLSIVVFVAGIKMFMDML